MINLEHIRLLETRITKAIEYVKNVKEENNLLKDRLNSYQVRIDELEVLVRQFKEDQGQIEDGILSALDRLNQFEDALESKLSSEPLNAAKKDQAVKAVPKSVKPESSPPAEKIDQESHIKPETGEAPPENGELEIF